MGLLPSRNAWRNWDWPTRFGVVTGVGSLAAGVVVTGFWLFGVDLGESARGRLAAMLSTEADPWQGLDRRRAEEMRPDATALAAEVVARLNSADLSGAIDYHKTYADGRCYDDDRYRELMKVRVAIAQFLYLDEENMIATNVYNRNLDLQDDLRQDRGAKLHALWRHMTSGGAHVSIREDLDLKLFARTLLDYYEKVTSTPNWQDRFEGLDPGHMDGKFWREGLHQPYARIGFPAAVDFCMNDHSYAFSLDTYLYSFWWRRWREGLMEASRIALESFLAMRIFAEPLANGD